MEAHRERERAGALLGSAAQEMGLFFRLRKDQAKEADTPVLAETNTSIQT